MDKINGLENEIAKMTKGLPHLPKSAKKWLADYAWALAIVGVALGALALYNAFRALQIIQAADAFLSMAAAWGANTGGYGMAKVYVYISLIASVAMVALMAIAIAPLKAKKHNGWRLSFYALLASAVLEIVSLVFNFGAFANVFVYLIGLAAGLYVLFEVREYFVPASKAKEAVKHSKK